MNGPVELHGVDQDQVSLGAEGWGLLPTPGTTYDPRLPVPQQLQVGIGQEVKGHRITHLKKKSIEEVGHT